MNPAGSGGPPTDDARSRSALALARGIRGFGAGALSVALALALAAAGYSPFAIGVALGLAMGASALWALLLPGRFAGLPRRTVLILGAGALAAGGFLLWIDLSNPLVLFVALALGGVVAGGSDISPLAAIEQGTLARVTDGRNRTSTFAIYNLVGYGGAALGALVAGPLGAFPGGPPTSVHGGSVLLLYGVLGLALLPTYLALPGDLPGPAGGARDRRLSPDHRARVVRLSALFSVDAFGGGMTTNALVAYFLYLHFGASEDLIGIIFALASVAAGASLLLAVPLARRFGLINTMVFTHIPSSLLLLLFPFGPTVAVAGTLWVARATLSQMDVPTRQSYVQAIVPREEGAAAAGYTTAARSGQALGAPVAGALFSGGAAWLAAPFELAGSLKIAYDLALYRGFRRLRPPEENLRPGPP